MMDIIEEKEFPPDYGVLHHQEGMDLIPANMELSGIEVSLANTMSREMILKEYIEKHEAEVIKIMMALYDKDENMRRSSLD